MSQPVESGRVRWMIVTLLVGFSLVSYIERMNISVAAQFMMPELGLTQVQMGRVFSAFVLGYALLQIPIGMLGDRIGPARILGWLGWLWAVLTVLTGYLPGIWGAAAALPVLIAIRFTLGPQASLSSQIVTGPSLSSETTMCAPNCPQATGTPRVWTVSAK